MTTSSTIAMHSVGDATIRFHQVELPDPSDHQVLVRMLATGICRSQLLEMDEHLDGGALPLGHEGIGIVDGVGASVDGLEPGDRVIVTWVPLAGEGIRPAEDAVLTLKDGGRTRPTEVYTWGTHVLVDEHYLVPAERGDGAPALSLVGCALTTGMGAAMWAGAVGFGDDVVIIGAGGVGLAALLGAVQAGAGRRIVVDLDADKLAFARRLGATHTVDASVIDPVPVIRALTGRLGQRGAEVVIDCVASTATIAQAVAAARPALLGSGPGGRVVLAGLAGGAITVPSYDLVMEQKSLIGTLAGGAGRSEMVRVLEAARSGRVDIAALVTDELAFDRIEDGIERLRSGRVLGRAIVLFHSDAGEGALDTVAP